MTIAVGVLVSRMPPDKFEMIWSSEKHICTQKYCMCDAKMECLRFGRTQICVDRTESVEPVVCVTGEIDKHRFISSKASWQIYETLKPSTDWRETSILGALHPGSYEIQHLVIEMTWKALHNLSAATEMPRFLVDRFLPAVQP